MQKKYEQMSLLDTYKGVEARLENNKPGLFRLLDEHLDWEEIIPARFYSVFYQWLGRKRGYGLESFLRALFLQRIFHYVEDFQLLNTLQFSYEMRDYCGFKKVPDASKLTRFKQDFCEYIRDVFERLVDMTEPICAEMDKTLADILVYDTTGIESYVAENNPKFMGKMAAQSRSITKLDPTFDPSGGAAALLPKAAASNPAVKLQYINGHFCYAQKAAVVANGLGIVRHLELFDDDFKTTHPEMEIGTRTKHPKVEKEIGDSTSLKPVLLDFKAARPNVHYSVFSADAAFDSYENFSFLLNDYGFQKAVIPLNPRSGLPASDVGFSENGTSLCPADGTPLKPCGHANESHRSPRLKFISPKSKLVKLSDGKRSFRCQYESPCSSVKYGRCVYVPLNKNLRLYPGISRDDPAFAQIYSRRTCVERSINSLKDTLGISNRKTSNVLTTKADLFLAGIVQLLCVLLAYKLHDIKLARRPRKLIA